MKHQFNFDKMTMLEGIELQALANKIRATEEPIPIELVWWVQKVSKFTKGNLINKMTYSEENIEEFNKFVVDSIDQFHKRINAKSWFANKMFGGQE